MKKLFLGILLLTGINNAYAYDNIQLTASAVLGATGIAMLYKGIWANNNPIEIKNSQDAIYAIPAGYNVCYKDSTGNIQLIQPQSVDTQSDKDRQAMGKAVTAFGGSLLLATAFFTVANNK